MLISMLARMMRLASIVICLIAIASFATFALDQTSSASTVQQNKVNETGPSDGATKASSHKSTAHEAIDKAFSTFASPFSGITSGSKSRWTIEIVDTLLILLVYGFGLSFLARVLPGRL